MKKVVLITGGFDPLHSGHISYLSESKKLGDTLVVGLNSDEWLDRKKGNYFMTFIERKTILENLKQVDLVIDFDDSADHAADAIMKTIAIFPKDKIIFANGGDRENSNSPDEELGIKGVEYAWGVGGNKTNSSSWILKDFLERHV